MLPILKNFPLYAIVIWKGLIPKDTTSSKMKIETGSFLAAERRFVTFRINFKAFDNALVPQAATDFEVLFVVKDTPT